MGDERRNCEREQSERQTKAEQAETNLLLGDGKEASHGVTGAGERTSEYSRSPGDDPTVQRPAFRHGNTLAVTSAEGDGSFGREGVEQGLDDLGRVLGCSSG